MLNRDANKRRGNTYGQKGNRTSGVLADWCQLVPMRTAINFSVCTSMLTGDDEAEKFDIAEGTADAIL